MKLTSIIAFPFNGMMYCYNYFTGKLPQKRAMTMQDRLQLREQYDTDLNSMLASREDLVRIGRASQSQTEKRKIASQIRFLDQDIKRSQTMLGIIASMINMQSAHEHHKKILDLAQSYMPDQEEITAAAVDAESVIEELQSRADIPDVNLSINISQEEQDILRELGGDTPKETANRDREKVIKEPTVKDISYTLLPSSEGKVSA